MSICVAGGVFDPGGLFPAGNIKNRKEDIMERALRGIAGFFVLLRLGLAVWVDSRWMWFTAFVGANLLQSAFTNWCPMMWILKKTVFRS